MQTNNKKFGFRTIIRGFLDAFNIEKGIVPTLIDLFIRPLEVIKCYIEGDKKKYFSPGRFFVTVTAFLSIITFLNGGFNEEKINKVINRSYETGYETGYGIGEKRWSKTEKSNKSLDEVFSVNHLAYFSLTLMLIEKMKNTEGGRIVNVASMAYRFVNEMNFEDLQSKENYKPMKVYGQSKLANILFTKRLASKVKENNIKSPT